jgi:hypothetical protein
MSEGKEVAVIEPQRGAAALLRPIAPVGDVLAAQNAARELIGKALTKGRDYGVIPGTGSKPTLLKPGAERLCAAFGAAPTFQVEEREVNHDRQQEWTKEKWEGAKGSRRKVAVSGTSIGLYRYVVRCTLVQRETGITLGEGIGVCSTMESKYIDRPRDLENTVLKMAEKRALIAATLITFGLSDQFTQDVEDMAENGDEEPAAILIAEVPAATGQLAILRGLIKSPAFTDKVRAGVEAEITAGLTHDRAVLLIEQAQARIAQRSEFDRTPAPSPEPVASQTADYDDSLPF